VSSSTSLARRHAIQAVQFGTQLLLDYVAGCIASLSYLMSSDVVFMHTLCSKAVYPLRKSHSSMSFYLHVFLPW
jgi:hypothetical protein